MGIRKDVKIYIKELEPYSLVNAQTVIKRLNEILENNKKKEKKKNYISVEQSSFDDVGDTFEALKDGYGLPPIGCKYVKVGE